MKKKKIILILFTFIFYFPLLAQQLTRPEPIRYTKNPQNLVEFYTNPFEKLQLGMDFQHIPLAPFYQFIWIFGDGNYHFDYTKRFYNDYRNNGHYETYIYPPRDLDLEYKVSCILIKRKTDEKPKTATFSLPQGNKVFINANSPCQDFYNSYQSHPFPDAHCDDNIYHTTPLLEELNNPNSCKRIKIDYSHNVNIPGVEPPDFYIKEGITVAFAFAFYLDQTPGDGEALLYFNNEVIDLEDRSLEILPPKYGPHTLPNNFQFYSRSESSDLFNGFDPHYNRLMVYKIPEDLKDLDTLPFKEELRFFMLLNSSVNIDQSVVYKFMGILTDSSPFVCKNSDPEGSPFLPESFKYNQIGPNGQYYVDSDLIEVLGFEPIDPSELKVVDICKVSNSPEKYQVDFKLKICNESTNKASGANVLIDDLNNDFHNFNLIPYRNDISVTSGNHGNWNDADCPICEEDQITDIFSEAESTFCLGNLNLKAFIDPINFELQQDCAFFQLTANTDTDGLNGLLKDFQSIKADIIFHFPKPCEIDPFTLYNIGLDTSQTIESTEGGVIEYYRTERQIKDLAIWNERDSPCTCICNACICEECINWPKWTLLGLLLISLVYIIRLKVINRNT